MSQATVISRSLNGLQSHKLSRRWYVGCAAALAAVSIVSLVIGLVRGQVNLAKPCGVNELLARVVGGLALTWLV